MELAIEAAPKPLSMLTTEIPLAQLFSMASKAAIPPKLAPYPTLVGTATLLFQSTAITWVQLAAAPAPVDAQARLPAERVRQVDGAGAVVGVAFGVGAHARRGHREQSARQGCQPPHSCGRNRLRVVSRPGRGTRG